MKKSVVLFLYFFLLLSFSWKASYSQSVKIIRGPYLNSMTPSSVIVRWRTNKLTDSRVAYGANMNELKLMITDTAKIADHELTLKGLQPASKYYYAIESAEGTLKVSPTQYFQTAPEAGSINPVRIWALGDFGNSSRNQLDCLNAICKVTADHKPDAWIWLGDNAYQRGSDKQYQRHVFRIYQQDFLKNTALYPSPGNHDYGSQIENHDIPYFKIFTMPTHGEAGGIPSGSESYYAVDYGNVHLVSLDSYGMLADGKRLYDTLSRQVSWLKEDLAANKLPWTIIYFHHPPYSKGSHDSDTEDLLVKIRQNLVPVLERYKVDLVLCGHSHVYERTHPILGHYGKADTFDPKKHIVAMSDSLNNYRVTGNRMGIIYIVNGSGGQIGGQQPGYPLKAATYYNNTVGGSILLDFSGNRLDARWICADGIIRDQFSIVKEGIK